MILSISALGCCGNKKAAFARKSKKSEITVFFERRSAAFYSRLYQLPVALNSLLDKHFHAFSVCSSSILERNLHDRLRIAFQSLQRNGFFRRDVVLQGANFIATRVARYCRPNGVVILGYRLLIGDDDCTYPYLRRLIFRYN